MEDPGQYGAMASVVHLFALADHAMTALEPEPLLALCAPEVAFCGQIARQVDEVTAADGAETLMLSTQVDHDMLVGQDVDASWVVEVDTEMLGTRSWVDPASGQWQVQVEDPVRQTLRVRLRHDGASWSVLEVGVP
ncbi:hypothetical protein [Cellulomonas shaoxiangyii]|uniref:Uncharacterized protein n=1 Tax=Cellulomonas shaoxiangyii TaxID=2566013 RepID=A0A4P7SFN5_9CELL|nr:hypothetical protein [Cellulomonas shaoxiangyii]QCB92361.1 hypothetical protein E5225_01115 [Cellulomonas shaoxiangyii]TGY86245.1 hypothetical protein E5226_02750 [Cellulomonas shaoxiangyii]